MPEFAPSASNDLPEPSATLVLIRVMVTAFLKTAHMKPRTRAREFVRIASELLTDEESASIVLPIRPASQRQATVLARRQAVAIYRQYLPTFLAAIPREANGED